MDAPSPDDGTSTQPDHLKTIRGKLSISGRTARGRFAGTTCYLVLYSSFFAWVMVNNFPAIETRAELGPSLLVVLINAFLVGSFIVFVTAQRLHDLNRSGWYGLLLLVPVINIGLLLMLLFKAGDPAPNRYGVRQGTAAAVDS